MNSNMKEVLIMKYNEVESMPMVLTVNDIADTLAIGRCKAYSLVNSGKIKSIKIGNAYRIPRAAFIAYLSGENDIVA